MVKQVLRKFRLIEEDFKEEDIYDEGGRCILVENDEISPEEEAFMAGYMGAY